MRPVAAFHAYMVKRSRLLSEYVSTQTRHWPDAVPSAWSLAGWANARISRSAPVARLTSATPENPGVQADA